MKTRFGNIHIAKSQSFSNHPNGIGISPYLQEKLVFLGQFEVFTQASELAAAAGRSNDARRGCLCQPD